LSTIEIQLKNNESELAEFNAAAAHALRKEVELCILQEHDGLSVSDLTARNTAQRIFQL
jgi:hypothetical protein